MVKFGTERVQVMRILQQVVCISQSSTDIKKYFHTNC